LSLEPSPENNIRHNHYGQGNSVGHTHESRHDKEARSYRGQEKWNCAEAMKHDAQVRMAMLSSCPEHHHPYVDNKIELNDRNDIADDWTDVS
jgi:hypothetical protein